MTSWILAEKRNAPSNKNRGKKLCRKKQIAMMRIILAGRKDFNFNFEKQN
jgi:hypothetical protein